MPRKNYRFIQNIDPQEFASRFSYTEDIETGEVIDCDKIDLDQYSKIDLGFSFADLQPFIERLPFREQDLITMYYQLNKDQAEIAKIFNISQGAVSHRIRKALKRLQFLVALPDITSEEMRIDLTEFFYPNGTEVYCKQCKDSFSKFQKNKKDPLKIKCPGFKKDSNKQEIIDSSGNKIPCNSEELIVNLDVQIMVLMWETSCQSVVRDKLGLSQIKVRHKFLKNIEKLEKAVEENNVWEKYVQGFNLLKENYNILREVQLPKWKNRQKSFIKH